MGCWPSPCEDEVPQPACCPYAEGASFSESHRMLPQSGQRLQGREGPTNISALANPVCGSGRQTRAVQKPTLRSSSDCGQWGEVAEVYSMSTYTFLPGTRRQAPTPPGLGWKGESSARFLSWQRPLTVAARVHLPPSWGGRAETRPLCQAMGDGSPSLKPRWLAGRRVQKTGLVGGW